MNEVAQENNFKEYGLEPTEVHAETGTQNQPEQPLPKENDIAVVGMLGILTVAVAIPAMINHKWQQHQRSKIKSN